VLPTHFVLTSVLDVCDLTFNPRLPMVIMHVRKITSRRPIGLKFWKQTNGRRTRPIVLSYPPTQSVNLNAGFIESQIVLLNSLKQTASAAIMHVFLILLGTSQSEKVWSSPLLGGVSVGELRVVDVDGITTTPHVWLTTILLTRLRLSNVLA